MNNDSGYTIDLPAKPGNDQRAVQIDGAPMQMAMQTAEAGDAVFAVGTITLPDESEATQRKALDFLRNGLARNVGAEPDARAVQIPLAAGGKVLGLEMKLSGQAGSDHEKRTVYARLVARGRHAYQAAIIASQPLPQEQVDQFFRLSSCIESGSFGRCKARRIRLCSESSVADLHANSRFTLKFSTCPRVLWITLLKTPVFSRRCPPHGHFASLRARRPQ